MKPTGKIPLRGSRIRGRGAIRTRGGRVLHDVTRSTELLMGTDIDVLFSDDIDGDNCEKSNDYEIYR